MGSRVPNKGSQSQPEEQASPTSRRVFLKTVAAAAAAGAASAMMPAGYLLAQDKTAAPARTGRVDVHHHMVPKFYNQMRGLEHVPFNNWTPARSVEQMEQHGISTAMLSSVLFVPNDPLAFGPKRREVARRLNEYGAKVRSDHPNHFGLFAALPLTDVEGSLKEIEYAHDTLKADGFGMWTSYGDKWPGDPSFEPIFAELDRRKAVVFMHPTAPDACSGTMVPGAGPAVVEFDFDTSRAVESLLVNGNLERFPNVRIILCHSGGTLPILCNRVADRWTAPSRPKSGPPYVSQADQDKAKRLMGTLYFEVAHATYRPPLQALFNMVTPARVLFGTDYPAEPMATTIEPLLAYGLPPETLTVIERGNAEIFFPRLKA